MTDKNNNFLNDNDITGSFDTDDIVQNKTLAAIGYIPVLFLVPLLAAPNSRFARFHANQGLILTLASIALYIAKAVIGNIFSYIPLVRLFVPSVINIVASVVVLAYIIIGMITAASGKGRKLPFIGGMLNILYSE